MRKNVLKRIGAVLLIACLMVCLIPASFADAAEANGIITIEPTCARIDPQTNTVVPGNVDFYVEYSFMIMEAYSGTVNGVSVNYKAGAVVAKKGSYDGKVTVSNLPRANYTIIASSDLIGKNYSVVPMSANLKTTQSVTLTPYFTGKHIYGSVQRVMQTEDDRFVPAEGSLVGLYGINTFSNTDPGNDIMAAIGGGTTGTDPVLIETAITDIDGLADFNVIAASFNAYMIKEVEPLAGQLLSEDYITFSVGTGDTYNFTASKYLKSYIDDSGASSGKKNVLIIGDDYIFGATSDSNSTNKNIEYYMELNGNMNVDSNGARGAGYTNGALMMIRRNVLINRDAIVLCFGMNDYGHSLGAATVLGDANSDGHVTAADAALVLRYIVNLNDLTFEEKRNADANEDGKITAADASCILRVIVGLMEMPDDSNSFEKQAELCIRKVKESSSVNTNIFIIAPWKQNKKYDVKYNNLYYSRQDMSDILENLCEEAGVTFVSISDSPERDKNVVGTNGYPTEYGYKMLAEWIVEKIG